MYGSIQKLGIGALLFAAMLHAASAQGAITFDAGGLASAGATNQVKFAYSDASDTTGTLSVIIENTATVGGRTSGFAFNVPTVTGASFLGIDGGLNNGGVLGIGSPNPSAVPENSSINESGWFQKWQSNTAKTSKAAGDSAFGVMKAEDSRAFITDGVGSGPRINNRLDGNDSKALTSNLLGTGLQSISNADFEAAFMNEQSSDTGYYRFGVRYQSISDSGLSDLAIPITSTTNPVPVPGAALLAALGLGVVGLVGRRRST